MNSQADIVVEDGQTFIEADYARLGTGLLMPPTRPLSFEPLSSGTPLMDMNLIKEVINRTDFQFGQALFGTETITYQNGYGSCAGWGGATALAKARFLEGQEYVDLSGDYLYSKTNGGRDRGSMLDDNMQALMSGGCCSSETVPLGGIYPNKYNRSVADAEAARFKGLRLFAVDSEQAMATALAMRMPVVIAIHVTRNWRKFDSRDVLAECNGMGNHCEHLDDIRYSDQYSRFEYRKATSHGKDYSGDGFCWTAWDLHYKQTSRNHMFYAVAGAIKDPLGPQPPIPDGASPSPEPGPSDTVKITMQTRSGCGWCSKWKSEVKPQAEALGWVIEEVTGSGSVPRFSVEYQGQTKTHTGFWALNEIKNAISFRQ